MTTKILLDESRLPRRWYNAVPDSRLRGALDALP